MNKSAGDHQKCCQIMLNQRANNMVRVKWTWPRKPGDPHSNSSSVIDLLSNSSICLESDSSTEGKVGGPGGYEPEPVP